MPNPTNMSGELLAVLTADATERTLTVDPQRKYALAHLGQDSAGLISTDPVYLSITQAVSADAQPNLDKAILPDKTSLTVGPNVTQIKYRTAAGEASIQVAAEN